MKADVHGDHASADEPRAAKVEELADLLIQCYGPQALERAERIEQQSLSVALASDVTNAVRAKLGLSP